MDSAYRPQARDTAAWAERMQFEVWRKMTSAEKGRLVSQLCRSLHRTSLAGLRARHPEATEAELEDMAARIRVGEELYQKGKAAMRSRR